MKHLHLVSNGQAPVCEAVDPGPTSSSTAKPSHWNRTSTKVARLLTAARQTATALLDAIVAGITGFFGPVEFSEEMTCEICEGVCGLVIACADPCTGPRHLADCTVCVCVVQLDDDKHCPNQKRHAVVNIRPKPPRSLKTAS